MSRDIALALKGWLEAGFWQIGEVAIERNGEQFELSHFQDAGQTNLRAHFQPEDARLLATYDEAENFRPLKSAPTLRRGWKLVLADLSSLRRALDFFYPAMLGTKLSHDEGALEPVPLRETLARQSGMYAVTKKTTDEQADGMIGDLCRSDGGCLKTILWRISADQPITSLPARKFDPLANQLPTSVRALPLLCSEACNLLVARAREVVKAASAQA